MWAAVSETGRAEVNRAGGTDEPLLVTAAGDIGLTNVQPTNPKRLSGCSTDTVR
jgi:hypothetical protein